jgi:double-stranded uracil-DNA glycosylase
MAAIHGFPAPGDYAEKLDLLRRTETGLWDVAHSAVRPGSMDHSIEQVDPNDLPGILDAHPRIALIAFNGSTAGALFRKHFDAGEFPRQVILPSTSPANASFSFDELCEAWRIIREF